MEWIPCEYVGFCRARRCGSEFLSTFSCVTLFYSYPWTLSRIGTPAGIQRAQSPYRTKYWLPGVAASNLDWIAVLGTKTTKGARTGPLFYLNIRCSRSNLLARPCLQTVIGRLYGKRQT